MSPFPLFGQSPPQTPPDNVRQKVTGGSVGTHPWSRVDISRILYPDQSRDDDHSSGIAVADDLEHATRPHATDHGSRKRCFRRRAACACTRWGLPCPDCHQPSGALLPHLFTLTPLLNRHRPRRDLQRSVDIDLVAGRYIFCGTVPSLATRPVGVTHHRVLRCSDFPPSKKTLRQRSSVHVRSIGIGK